MTNPSNGRTSLQRLFDGIVALIRDTPVTPELQISDSDKLSMYGLYKQATVGACTTSTAAPSRFQLVARTKYQAWLDCEELTKEQAMLQYVQLASSHDHWLGIKCREKLLEWEQSVDSSSNESEQSADESAKSSDASLLPSSDNDERRSSTQNTTIVSESEPASSNDQSATRFHSWLDKHFGIRPLIPRGQLDISYRDLTFAAWHCIRCSSSVSRYCQLEQEITQLWNNSSSNPTTTEKSSAVITGLSVRSLFDLYLRAASFPPDSEIIMSPPINIPGMLQVLQHHGINVIPVDVPQDRVVSVDMEAIQQAITPKTVAIMIVHPFGMISTTSDDTKSLRSLADKHKLHLLEDCAECFTGLNGDECYKGSDCADVSFFSFGTIKTATALGGGVAILHNTLQTDKMNRMHHSLYKQQTAAQYLRKVLWCSVVRFLADCPLLYGIIFALLSWCGLNFDAIVASSTRGFSATAKRGMDSRSNDALYMEQLRKRPSTALLSVLARRLQQSQTSVPSVKLRVERCKYMATMLEKLAPNVKLPVTLSDSANTYWLFPIQVDEPDAVSRRLCKDGFDVPRGLSQLECVTKYCPNQKSCSRTEEMMNRVLYLPVASRNMSKQDILRMAVALNSATTATSSPEADDDATCEGICGACRRRKRKNRSRGRVFSTVVALLVVAVDALLFCRLPLSGFVFFSMKAVLNFVVVTMTIAISAAAAMRWTMADFYLKSSKCFAKHSSMLFEQRPADSDSDDSSAFTIPEAGEDPNPLLNMDALRIPSPSTASGGSAESIEHGVVLLTGATGFIGRLLLRDLLLHRRSLSIPGGVVVLCRSKQGNSAHRRVSKLLNDPMYSFLSEAKKQELVHVVEGDVTKPNVGLSPEDMDRVCNVLSVSHVIHCAASVSFTQTLKEAAVSNITSSLNLQSLTGRLKLNSARYVHISTAFVHGGLTGSESDPLPEQLHTLEGYDAADLFRSMLGTEYRASVAMNELRFPNTYTFSKCICENLLARNKTVPTVIVRPSIVGPAVQQPYEGWAGDKPTTIVAAACLYMSYQWNLWCFGNHRVPYIPVDVVSSFILAKAFASGKGASEETTKACVSPSVSSSSDDGFERVSQMSESSLSEADDALTSTSSAGSDRAQDEQFTIHNLAWDRKSPDSAMFTWVDYAVAVTHLGAFLGYFSRLTAYIGLFATVRVLPGMKVKEGRFRVLHRALVQFPIDTIVSLFKMMGWRPQPIKKLSMLSPFLDLPLLFFQFMNNDFYFSSELVAPGELDGEKYLFSCAMAAEHFVAAIKARRERKDSTREARTSFEEPGASVLSLGGAAHEPTSSDMWWALTQPRGGFFVRLAGWVFRKLLRASSVDVTIDAQSFSLAGLTQSSTKKTSPPIVVLAPNHRSFFDFLLVSYLCFALPELQIEIPFIAAADDFERLPLIGWLAARANAFFLRRNRGKADPSLKETLGALYDNCGDEGLCVEVFLEGSRSRDRRYLRPKTGLLRCLAETGGDLVVVPISINYEEVPEQSNLAIEVEGGHRAKLNSQGLFPWLKKAFLGNVNIGRIHVAAASPLHVDSSAENDFGALTTNIQRRQQDLVRVSSYHIKSASAALDLSPDTVEQALTAVGCSFWPDYRGIEKKCMMCRASPLQSTSTSEQWMVLLHFGHKLSPFFEVTQPRWCKWLNEIGGGDNTSGTHDLHPSVESLVGALGKSFDEADECADQALTRLRANGFHIPEGDHVIQSMLKESVDCPTLLLRAAVAFKLEIDEPLFSGSRSCDDTLLDMVDSPDDDDMSCGDESLGFWGFRDSGFVLQVNQNGETSVTMHGDRYSICGKSLKKLIPFIENETNTRIDLLKESPFPSPVLGPLPSDLTDESIDLLKSSFTKVSTSKCDRIRHGSGHSQEDVFLIRSGAINDIRLPDAVVWPSSEDEVEQLVVMAKSNDWCLIPFGGGTNVSHATRCPTREIEPRPILSVDTRLMDRVLWVNEEDGLAHVQSGITGRALVEEMARRGYTIGHEPDSIEFSTLGGWIATKASGMKRNKYGNIEDIVKSVRVAGSGGLLWRGKRSDDDDAGPFGRESRGVDLLSLTLGSEGSFGIITSAVLRIWPLPECQEHESVILPDFEHGLRFARDAARLGPNLPSSVRLLDNEHFRLGQALRGESSILERSLTHLWKMAHPVIRSCSPDSVVCATILFEGTREEVQSQRRAIMALASKHGGTSVGARVGKSGYELTFAIAYLRDFALTYNFLAESFETFAPWSKVERIIAATKQRIQQEHARRCLPGEAFVGSRVTQLYHEGACLYFYFCMNIRGVTNPSAVFAEIEHAARQEILENGGSLSHHHGIGKLRSDFCKEMDSDEYHGLLASLKESVDPSNTFGVRNGALA